LGDEVIRKISVFIAGFLFGFLIDLIPRLTELSLNVYLCREACPAWFRGASMIAYLAIPIFWGVFALWTFGREGISVGKTPKAIAFAASLLLICTITWMAYAYHNQII
jgi:hypothetical protein